MGGLTAFLIITAGWSLLLLSFMAWKLNAMSIDLRLLVDDLEEVHSLNKTLDLKCHELTERNAELRELVEYLSEEEGRYPVRIRN